MRLGKKGAFDTINAGMIGFISFVLIAILVILMVSQIQNTETVCMDGTIRDGDCVSCTSPFALNTTNKVCCNNTGSVLSCAPATNHTAPLYPSHAYNATKDLQTASGLPPQFAQIIVIVIIIVGILGMLAFVGYSAYKRMR